MTNAHDLALATPEQRRALRRQQGQRLRDQAERILRAFEALPDPKTVAEAERMAKALKAIEVVVTQTSGPEMRGPETHEEWVAEQMALDTWLPVLDQRLAALTPRDDAETAPAQKPRPS
jgi:hypothetical protein